MGLRPGSRPGIGFGGLVLLGSGVTLVCIGAVDWFLLLFLWDMFEKGNFNSVL